VRRGFTSSTEKLRTTTALWLRARSIAYTRKVCAPLLSVRVMPGVQFEKKASLSRRHRYVSIGSLPVNWKATVPPTSWPSAGEEAVTTGGVPSTVTWRVAAPTLPAASVAWIVITWAPSPGLTRRTNGVAHGAGAPASTWQVKVAGLLAENQMGSTGCMTAPSAGAVMLTTGRTVSTVNPRDASGPWFPSVSVARTKNACVPLVRFVKSWRPALEHGASAAASSAHAKLADASDVNVKLAAVPVKPVSAPLVITVAGPVVSTTQVLLAGVGSTMPSALVARTRKLWAPSGSALTVTGD
jgi:hypothetical protein